MLSDTNWPAEEVGQFNIPPCLIPPLRHALPFFQAVMNEQ